MIEFDNFINDERRDSFRKGGVPFFMKIPKIVKVYLIAGIKTI
jgi:hypothetical protein